MIKFRKLTYQNFLSTGAKPTSIQLDAEFTTLIVGKNGAGKSTMLDALSFALFNKSHRAINRPQLINSINNKKCLVTVEFTIGQIEYRIVRGMKPNVFEIWQDGKQLNQESHSRDYQKLLETNILKLNHKSFHQVVVLGSGNFVPFMQLTTYQRRGVIEDLLDISVFTKMNVLLKEMAAKHKDKIKDTDHAIDLINEKIKLQSKHLSDLQQIDERNSKSIQDEIDSLNAQIIELCATNEDLTEKHKTRFELIRKELTKQQSYLKELHTVENNFKFKMKEIVDDAKFYETNDSCPKCGQHIHEDTKNSHLSQCKDRAKELSEGYVGLQQKIKSITDLVEVTSSDLNEIMRLPTLVSANNNVITNNNSRISSLSKQLKTNHSSDDVTRAKDDLMKLRESKVNLNEVKQKQIDDKKYYDVIYELLKDTGIKTKIIKQYLPVMNKLINQYLQILDFFVLFNLDENFNETIKSRHRDDFSYASFSEGEKSRIDLALLFAWRQIAKLKNSTNTNLLILDETFDGSLDADGVENLMQILNTLDPETRVFIISHKQDLLEGKFDRKLEFETYKLFSRIKTTD
jgi:DNA repair exonuclease SbcCD ATPase subunit